MYNIFYQVYLCRARPRQIKNRQEIYWRRKDQSINPWRSSSLWQYSKIRKFPTFYYKIGNQIALKEIIKLSRYCHLCKLSQRNWSWQSTRFYLHLSLFSSPMQAMPYFLYQWSIFKEKRVFKMLKKRMHRWNSSRSNQRNYWKILILETFKFSSQRNV